MGRKSSDKERKSRQQKVDEWMQELLPKLQAYSPQKITMDELAALIGKRKSTLYEYFSSKEEVLMAAVQLRLRQMTNYKYLIDLEKGNILGIYKTLMELLCKGGEDISMTFLNNLEQHFPRVWEEVEKFLQEVLRDISKIYLMGMEKGLFRKVSITLLLSLDNFFVSQMITNKVIFESNKVTLDQLVREYLELRLVGLSQVVPENEPK